MTATSTATPGNSDWKDLPENEDKPACKTCNGSGQAGKETCPACGGFGY